MRRDPRVIQGALADAHHVLVLVVFRGQQVCVPRVLQWAPIDSVTMLSRTHTSPTTDAILELATLIAAAMHLPVVEAGEARGGGSAAALREKITREHRGTPCCECVAILITAPPAAEADAEDLSEKLLCLPH
eukprot:3728438-Prymnesium_polylepis.1